MQIDRKAICELEETDENILAGLLNEYHLRGKISLAMQRVTQ